MRESTRRFLADTTSKYATTEEVAVLLRRTPAVIRKMVARGQIPEEFIYRLPPGPKAKTKRTRLMFNRVALERFLQGGRS